MRLITNLIPAICASTPVAIKSAVACNRLHYKFTLPSTTIDTSENVLMDLFQTYVCTSICLLVNNLLNSRFIGCESLQEMLSDLGPVIFPSDLYSFVQISLSFQSTFSLLHFIHLLFMKSFHSGRLQDPTLLFFHS